MEIYWPLFALLAMLTQPGIALLSQWFQVPIAPMLLIMRGICCLVVLPFALLYPAPDDPAFYIYVIIAAFLFAYYDLRQASISKQHGAGQITRLEPLAVAVTFLIWLALFPSSLLAYWDEPIRFALILLSFTGSLFFAMNLRRSPISAEVLKAFLPSVILGGTGIVLAKLAFESTEFPAAVLYYATLQTAVTFTIYCGDFAKQIHAKQYSWNVLISPKIIIAACCVSIAWLCHALSKHTAIYAVDNPAFVTMIGLLSPLWVLILYRIVKHQEKGNIKAGLGIVFCAAILIAATQL